MDLEILQALIGSYGFPVVVTGYLLWERRTMIGQLTNAINDMRTAVVELTASMSKDRS